MKKFIFYCIFILTFSGCSKDIKVDNNLVGTWQYKEFIGFVYNVPPPILILSGEIIKFNADYTFTSNGIQNSTGGTYAISSGNVITLTYILSDNSTYIRTKKINEQTGSKLVLDPTDRSCAEGCKERYERL